MLVYGDVSGSMRGMNGSEIKQFRQKLLSLRAELLDLEESSKEATQPKELDQACMGRLSRRMPCKRS